MIQQKNTIAILFNLKITELKSNYKITKQFLSIVIYTKLLRWNAYLVSAGLPLLGFLPIGYDLASLGN